MTASKSSWSTKFSSEELIYCVALYNGQAILALAQCSNGVVLLSARAIMLLPGFRE